MRRALRDQTGRGNHQFGLVEASPLAYIYESDKPGLPILHNILAVYQTQD